ncbi:MAG: hypothetical protein RQ826_17520 [Xanthomonadales bacterium]|nr:hypothetical protein [Xanthomonadales bacterium]
MEYVYYLMTTFAVLALCLVPFCRARQRRADERKMILAERARARRQRLEAQKRAAAEAPLPDHKQILQRELSKVPTPWGWPRHDESGVPAGKHPVRSGRSHDRGGSGSLARWADSLLREKRTIDDGAYRRRRETALRALLEDRYGRRVGATEIPYRKVAAPRLRDPAAPHDQMDNFPSGKTDEIIARIRRSESGLKTDQQVIERADLTRVRKPWGW